MNTDSINCRKVQSIEQVGDFTFDDDYRHIYIWVPGMSGPDAIPINRGHAPGPRTWGWNGDTERPTLHPSILAPDQWHGFLRDGRLESC